jgi:hypothetical protein
MRQTLRRLLPLLGLAGCTGVPMIGNVYYDSAYRPGEQAYAGPLGVDVPGGGPELTQAVIEAMQGATFGVPSRLESWTPQSRSPYRLVVIFDPPRALSAGRMCEGPPPPNPRPARAMVQIPVSATLCRADKVMSAADAGVPFADGPNTPGFRKGLSQVMIALFPARNPHLDVMPD